MANNDQGRPEIRHSDKGLDENFPRTAVPHRGCKLKQIEVTHLVDQFKLHILNKLRHVEMTYADANWVSLLCSPGAVLAAQLVIINEV